MSNVDSTHIVFDSWKDYDFRMLVVCDLSTGKCTKFQVYPYAPNYDFVLEQNPDILEDRNRYSSPGFSQYNWPVPAKPFQLFVGEFIEELVHVYGYCDEIAEDASWLYGQWMLGHTAKDAVKDHPIYQEWLEKQPC